MNMNMKHERDRYSYYIQIGRCLGVKIESMKDLKSHLPLIPGLENKDLRKLDNLKIILDYLEEQIGKNQVQLTNNKYRGLIGLQMEGENLKKYRLTPYLVLYIQIENTDGNWITLRNSRLEFPLTIDDLNKEFERLINKIEEPQYEDD